MSSPIKGPRKKMSAFLEQDRDLLIQVATNLDNLQKAFDKLIAKHEEDPPVTRGEFYGLQGKVQILENFRWYMMGIALAAGPIVHYIVEGIFVKKG